MHAACESAEGWGSCINGKECPEKAGQQESKQGVQWLEDGERFLADVHWSGDESQSSVNQAFTGNQSLHSQVPFF